VAERFGCELYLSKIGEVNVTDEMRRVGAVVGGEGNGGVIYPRINFARDSLVGMALILHLLAESGKSVSELMDSLPRFKMVKDKLICPSHTIPRVLRMVRDSYEGFPLDTRDGVKVVLPDGWLLVRGSNTEPIVRVVAEASTEERAREIVGDVYTRVQAVINS
jgi:phosphomannomutase